MTYTQKYQQVSLQSHVEPIAEYVSGVFVIRFGRSRVAVFDEQPTNVAPERAHLRRVRIGLMIGMLMVDAMHDHPPGGRLLQVAHAQEGQRVLQPQRALVTAMGKQPMEPGADAHRAENVIPNRQPHQTPPAKKIGKECQRNQQMEENDADYVRPNDATLIIDELRPRELQCA